LTQARGDVVEIAVGTGLNIPLYPQEASRVVGIELSEPMLDIARKRLASAGLTGRMEVRQGDAQALDLPDESADTVISTYTLCTIPDPQAACREAWRILRPGGRFVLAEHGPSTRAAIRALMAVVDPLSVRFGADHLTRDPIPYLEAGGFTVQESHRSGRAGVVFRVVATKVE
jgi:ubiquinone/menaquinone biosynthesis C-methylase UbiE